MGGALCCDATLVSPLTRTGQPQPCAAAHDGAMLRVAERRKRTTYPELSSRGSPWPAPPHASQPQGPELDRVLDLAEAEGPSRLPLR